jgi:hypothetical protein
MKRRHKRIAFIFVGLAGLGVAAYLVRVPFAIISSSFLVRLKWPPKRRLSIAPFALAGSFRKAH